MGIAGGRRGRWNFVDTDMKLPTKLNIYIT